MARQRLGQHFLADPAVRERIRASLPLRPNDIWLEIGAGHGEMTQRPRRQRPPRHRRPSRSQKIRPAPRRRPQKARNEWPGCLSSNGVFGPGIGSHWPVGISRLWQHPLLHHFPYPPSFVKLRAQYPFHPRGPSSRNRRTHCLSPVPKRTTETLQDCMRLSMMRVSRGG
jgi:hypothetical protein